MKCQHCGTAVQKDDKFCLKCGSHLVHGHDQKAEGETSVVADTGSLPAEQAEKVLKDAKVLLSRLSKEEKIIGGGALLSLLGYLLPWHGGAYLATRNGLSFAEADGFFYLLPLASVASLVILYFSQGLKHNFKIFMLTLYAVCGTIIAASGIDAYNSTALIGIWLTILGGLVVAGTAIYQQKNILLKNK